MDERNSSKGTCSDIVQNPNGTFTYCTDVLLLTSGALPAT